MAPVVPIMFTLLDEGVGEPAQAARKSRTRAKRCCTVDMLRLLVPRHDIGRPSMSTVWSEAPRNKSMFVTRRLVSPEHAEPADESERDSVEER